MFEGRLLTLLPEEPAGRISTRNAGAISFRATLTAHPDGSVLSGPIIGAPVPGARFCHLTEKYDVASSTWEISCEIRALYDEQLGSALDAALRSVTSYAASTETVLEARAIRTAEPSVAPAAHVEELAWDLSSAGLRATFGPSWTPAPHGGLSVGVRGLQDAFQSFLQTHPVWRECVPLDR